jgi:predicted helicase
MACYSPFNQKNSYLTHLLLHGMLSMARFFPHEKSSTEGIVIVTSPAKGRQIGQFSNITPSDNNVIQLESFC